MTANIRSRGLSLRQRRERREGLDGLDGARSSTRARQRAMGAALVEALIVIPVLVILNVSLLYVFDVYRTKIATTRSARELLWTRTTSGCEGNSTNSGTTEVRDGAGDNSMATLASTLSSAKELASQANVKAPFSTTVRSATAKATGQATAQASGGATYGAQTATTTTGGVCNEVQKAISDADVRKEATDRFEKWVLQ